MWQPWLNWIVFLLIILFAWLSKENMRLEKSKMLCQDGHISLALLNQSIRSPPNQITPDPTVGRNLISHKYKEELYYA